MMIAQLKSDHDRLRDLADQMDVFLSNDQPPADPQFSRLRWMLVRELSMHLAVERRVLTEWRTTAGASGADLDLGLDEAFMQHVATWSGASMTTTWTPYCVATHILLNRLRKRMDVEEEEMFPALSERRAV